MEALAIMEELEDIFEEANNRYGCDRATMHPLNLLWRDIGDAFLKIATWHKGPFENSKTCFQNAAKYYQRHSHTHLR